MYLQVAEVHHQIHFLCWQSMLGKKKHLGSKTVHHTHSVAMLCMKIHSLAAKVDKAQLGC